jgi:NTP pyrophosphatase (non-canonical NTP hydrolase)
MLSRQELLLVAVMEECSEVAKRASKSLRFGIHENPINRKDGKNNLVLIAEELIDLLTIMKLLDEELGGELDREIMKQEAEGAVDKKKAKFQQFVEYSQMKGCVEK